MKLPNHDEAVINLKIADACEQLDIEPGDLDKLLAPLVDKIAARLVRITAADSGPPDRAPA